MLHVVCKDFRLGNLDGLGKAVSKGKVGLPRWAKSYAISKLLDWMSSHFKGVEDEETGSEGQTAWCS